MLSSDKLRSHATKAMTMGSLLLATMSMTGCVGILPNSNTEAGQKKIDEVHSVVYTVKAPFGTKVTYSNGAESSSGLVNNLGQWTQKSDVKGIVSVTIDATTDSPDSSITCGITVDGVDVATGMSNGDGHAICKGSTSKT